MLATGRTLLTASIIAGACGIATLGHAQDGPVVAAPNRNMTVARSPAKPPVLNQADVSADFVVIKWADGGDNTVRFNIYKRNSAGAWATVATVHKTAASDSAGYRWTDSAKNVSGQCYRVSAQAEYGTAASGPVGCTVRPDGFPTGSVDRYKKWWGLSNINRGLGKLRRADRTDDLHLVRESQTFGVNLGLDKGGNNLKLQRTGNNPEPLMYGEKLAMRVWGAGWVKFGTETFGINLQLSDTPSYEWIVLGGDIGKPLDDQRIALWNTKEKAFVVPGSREWGVQMVWRGGTPSVPTTPPTPHGPKSVSVVNCSVDRRPMGMWVLDTSATSGWTDSGIIDQQYTDGTCPAEHLPWRVSLIAGHTYLIWAIDYTAPDCLNDPEEVQSSCKKMQRTITGGDGLELPITIS